ncbi:MAG: trimethylamine methyltransferase family protein [Saccharofermentanales bacterium]
MPRKGLENNLNLLELLSEKELDRIHESTLEVLQNTGVRILDPVMQDRLVNAGCSLKPGTDVVCFTEKIIMDSLAASPKNFIGKARDSKNDVVFEAGRTSYFIPACGMKTVDLDTWEVREPTRKEFYDNIIVLDALEHVDMQNCFPYFGFSKVPECMKLIESTAAKFRASSKAQIEGSVFDNYIWNIELAKAVGADLFQLVNSAAPLAYFKETTDQIGYYANADMPFHFSAGPTRGLSGPATIAGSLVSNNAEALAGIVMAQLAKPGSRVWVNSMIMTPNMQNGSPAFGDIGNSLTDAAFCQIWRRYGISSWPNCASWTNSKCIDYQAGYETGIPAMLMALAGATAISFHGGLNAELSVHPVKSIIDNDVAGMIKRFVKGIEITPDTLAVDLINEVGQMPASFLDSDHTFEWWRNDCYLPETANREQQSFWMSNGKKTVLDSAKEKYDYILQTHKPVPLTDSQESAVEYILQDARNYYHKKGMISDEEWRAYQEDLHSINYPFA